MPPGIKTESYVVFFAAFLERKTEDSIENSKK
jgi:hypothetical protein